MRRAQVGPPRSARVSAHRQYAVQRGVLPASDLHRLLLHAEGEEHSQCVLHKCGHDEDLGDRLSGPQRCVSVACGEARQSGALLPWDWFRHL